MRAMNVLLIGALALVMAGTPAHGAAIDDGVTWLHEAQDESGLWGTDNDTPIRDTAIAIEVLSSLAADSAGVPNGVDALLGTPTSSVDYLARKVITLASYAQGQIESGLVAALASMQASDGGWGFAAGYGSNILDTALAMRALQLGGYSNLVIEGAGINYLTSAQNADGGWSFADGGASLVFYTAHVVFALSAYEGEFDVAQELEDASTWLKSQPHVDGGFGSGATSNPYETGMAVVAVAKVDPLATEIADATGYLEATQLPNGSWKDDAYSTAWAIRGLSYVGPDLAISAADIVLSNPTPTDGDVVTVSTTVRNRGVAPSDASVVQVFDGDPDLGGVQLGVDQPLAGLDPGGEDTVEVEWNTYGLAGNHEIFVVVDPTDAIEEPDELNNVGIRTVHVYYPPDLIIDSITFEPAEPETTDAVTIKTTVRNVGEVTATGVTLQIWDSEEWSGGLFPDEPLGTPLLSPPYTIPSIAPNGTFTLNLNMGDYFTSPGGYYICACADVNDTIRETSEENNCDCNTLWVSIQCREVTLSNNLNLLGPPLEPTADMTSFSLLPEIIGCTEIDGWDRDTQTWISAVDVGDGTVIGDDFALELRDGFFARLSEESMADLCGRPLSGHGCTQLEDGLNMVSVPNEDACYSAYTLINDISSCTEAHAWDTGTQTWNSAIKIGGDEFIGEDFPVVVGAGYFVKVDTGGEWCTSTCDTVTVLPDLLITEADIWLDPNPVQSGNPVGIWVNIQNIGTETALTPRLDIYAGDPDDGGTLLLGGYLPVDIPPGESSGYYGNTFTFSGEGFIDIYGIADFYDEIEELDEANNRAFQTLQVLGAVRGSSALAWTPPLDSSLQLRQTVTEITRILVGNHSSSSVTISWITDAPCRGLVEYGLTPALGASEPEAGPSGCVHRVVLRGLREQTDYVFRITSGDITDDNEGRCHAFRTVSCGAGTPSILYGRVVSSATGRGIPGARVSGRLVRDVEDDTYPLIARTDADGDWILNLGNLKSRETGSVRDAIVGGQFVVGYDGGGGNTGSETVRLAGKSPQSCGEQELYDDDDPFDLAAPTPSHFFLAAGAPNPFRTGTTLSFGLPQDGRVEMAMYNVAGQKVATLIDGEYPAGTHSVMWDGRTDQGHPAFSGIYFCRMKADGATRMRRVFLMR